MQWLQYKLHGILQGAWTRSFHKCREEQKLTDSHILMGNHAVMEINSSNNSESDSEAEPEQPAAAAAPRTAAATPTAEQTAQMLKLTGKQLPWLR